VGVETTQHTRDKVSAYKLKTYTTGKFEIYNVTRDKVVYAGTDPAMKENGGKSYTYKDVKELMRGIGRLVSLATFKKVSKVICAW